MTKMLVWLDLSRMESNDERRRTSSVSFTEGVILINGLSTSATARPIDASPVTRLALQSTTTGKQLYLRPLRTVHGAFRECTRCSVFLRRAEQMPLEIHTPRVSGLFCLQIENVTELGASRPATVFNSWDRCQCQCEAKQICPFIPV
jgi:hypothetical protein